MNLMDVSYGPEVRRRYTEVKKEFIIIFCIDQQIEYN
jgi:hypothetical protein